MQPSAETEWPESLRSLYAQVSGASPVEAVAENARWREEFAQWVKGAPLEERTRAQAAAWERLAPGERTAGELLFLLSTCSELLWPYAAPPAGLLRNLMDRQTAVVQALTEAGDGGAAIRVRRETNASLSTVLTRILKRHPESLLSLVEGVSCTFDGRALRFQDVVEVDLKQVLGTGTKSVGLLEQLRTLLPDTKEEGRDKLADFIRTRAARIPWREASEVLAERLFLLATSPEGRSGMRGFLACYPNGRKDPDWCSRAGMLLARTVEVGGPQPVVENLCELLALFDAPPLDGLRGALGALVQSDFETAANLGHARFVLDHCQATLRKNEPGLALALLWLEERLFRAAVKRGLPEAFERRSKARARLESLSGFVHLCWLAEECAELWPRFRSGARPGLDELAAWRQQVAARMGRKPVLRKAAIEFFLWCAPEEASSEAELAVLALARTATDKRLVKKMLEHPSPRVRFRALALQAWFQGGTGKDAVAPAQASAPTTLTEALRHLHSTRAVPVGGRTWLRDRDLEELLVGSVGRVEAEFASRYPERFREDAAELVAGLLDGIRGEFERIRSDLSSLLAQGQAAPLDLRFTVRRNGATVEGPENDGRDDPHPVPFPEGEGAPSEPGAGMEARAEQPRTSEGEGEGAPSEPGAGMEVRAERPRSSGVSVAFVLKVDVEGFARTQRAVLVEVVKLEQRGAGQWLPSFRLGQERLDELLGLTESAFCLFLVPSFVRAESWVLPARMARGMMVAQRALSGVPRESVQRAARSLAQWLVFDWMGLWTGDERPELVDRAQADVTSGGPDFVVDLRIRSGAGYPASSTFSR